MDARALGLDERVDVVVFVDVFDALDDIVLMIPFTNRKRSWDPP
jgi:hypothetical protein